MPESARTPSRGSLFGINTAAWAAWVDQHQRDCERLARSAATDKVLKAGSARAMAESRNLLADVERLVRLKIV
jgi:hypothetical protein